MIRLSLLYDLTKDCTDRSVKMSNALCMLVMQVCSQFSVLLVANEAIAVVWLSVHVLVY